MASFVHSIRIDAAGPPSVFTLSIRLLGNTYEVVGDVGCDRTDAGLGRY